jgi:hypothetical protein
MKQHGNQVGASIRFDIDRQPPPYTPKVSRAAHMTSGELGGIIEQKLASSKECMFKKI